MTDHTIKPTIQMTTEQEKGLDGLKRISGVDPHVITNSQGVALGYYAFWMCPNCKNLHYGFCDFRHGIVSMSFTLEAAQEMLKTLQETIQKMMN